LESRNEKEDRDRILFTEKHDGTLKKSVRIKEVDVLV